MIELNTALLEPLRVSGATLALGAARVLPVAIFSPAFGGRVVPGPARLTLGLSLGLCAPAVATLPEGLDLLESVGRELALGTLLAVVAAAPFALMQTAGGLLDQLRGGGQATLDHPLTGPASPLAVTLHQLLLCAVFAAGGAQLVVASFLKGWALLPPGAPLPGLGATGPAEALALVTALSSQSLSFAAPTLAALALLDLALGLAGRLNPQLSLYFLSLPAKTPIALLVLGLSLPVILRAGLEACLSGLGAPAALLELWRAS